MSYVQRPYRTPGYTQIAVIKTAEAVEWFRAEFHREYQACLKLHGHGFLKRHPQDRNLFQITDRAREWLRGGAAA